VAGIADVRECALEIVNRICGKKARSFSEANMGRILHAYLVGRHAGVWAECPVNLGKTESAIDFRFGDRPHGKNPCVLELAVRNSEGGSQLLASQNKPELRKLSRYPESQAQTRVLLLLDIGHAPLAREKLQPDYDNLKHLGAGKFQRRSVSILYVHRELDYRFIWRAQ
jgi:hypothetical protein